MCGHKKLLAPLQQKIYFFTNNKYEMKYTWAMEVTWFLASIYVASLIYLSSLKLLGVGPCMSFIIYISCSSLRQETCIPSLRNLVLNYDKILLKII
jgi:hypothetical protein